MTSLVVLIKKLRKAGLTQADIALKTGVSQPTISRVESGVSLDMPFTNGKKIEEFALKFFKRKIA